MGRDSDASSRKSPTSPTISPSSWSAALESTLVSVSELAATLASASPETLIAITAMVLAELEKRSKQEVNH